MGVPNSPACPKLNAKQSARGGGAILRGLADLQMNTSDYSHQSSPIEGTKSPYRGVHYIKGFCPPLGLLMSQHRTARVIEHLRRAGLLDEGESLSDAELLALYTNEGKTDAFTSIVQRHGPMVWNVCSRMLKHRADVEDAFQATFLVLVRKARSLKTPELLGNWLYGVAYCVARKVRSQLQRKGVRETSIEHLDEFALPVNEWQELLPLLDESLASLPEKYRLPIVLCDLQGLARREVAQQLELPEGTVASRHARGREMLAKKLRKHGVALGTLATIFEQGVTSAKLPNILIYSTLQMIGQTSDALKTLRINQLSNGVIQQMGYQKLKLLSFASVAFVCVAIGAYSLNGLPEIVGQVVLKNDLPKEAPKKDDPKKEEPKKEALKREEPKNKLDPEVVKAWVAAGSIAGWMGSLPNGLVEFRPYPDGLKNPIPSFKFQTGSKFDFTKLPAPKSAFGLDFTNVALTDISLKKLAVFENVQHLELTGTLTSSDSIKELTKFPNLQFLSLKGKRNIREEDSPLLAKLPKLRALDLRGTPLLTKEYRPLKDAPNLRILCIGGRDTKKELWAELKACQQLTYLIAEDVPTNPDIWKEIAELKKLEYLEINGSIGFRRDPDLKKQLVIVKELTKLPELRSLVLRDMILSEEQGIFLKDCKKIENLEYIIDTDSKREVELRGTLKLYNLEEIDQVKTLISLKISGRDTYSRRGKVIAKHPKLETLELVSTERYAYQDVPELTNVKRLIMNNASSSSLVELKKLDKLESIEISISFFDEDAGKDLAEIKNLTYLNIDCIRHHTAKHLSQLTQVQTLVLSSRNNSIRFVPPKEPFVAPPKQLSLNDDSLKELVTLKNLRYLEISDTDVTEKGIEELRKALPDCVIIRN